MSEHTPAPVSDIPGWRAGDRVCARCRRATAFLGVRVRGELLFVCLGCHGRIHDLEEQD